MTRFFFPADLPQLGAIYALFMCVLVPRLILCGSAVYGCDHVKQYMGTFRFEVPILQGSYLFKLRQEHFLTDKIKVSFPTRFTQQPDIPQLSSSGPVLVHFFLCIELLRLDGETFTIVQVLNPSVYDHVHFDGVVCLECTFISQDTKLFPGSG